jgi:hypothetical protein
MRALPVLVACGVWVAERIFEVKKEYVDSISRSTGERQCDC